MTDYKDLTKQAYNQFADDFEDKFESYLEKNLKDKLSDFLADVPKGGKILDLGSGPGNYAINFKRLGFQVLCIDNSEEMIKRCKEKGLPAMVMDFEKLDFPEKSFDAVWAYTSLLHVPKKNIPEILKKISKIMKDQSILLLGMKYGEGEGFREQEKYPGTKRWFSLYTKEELESYLTPLFEILYYSETIAGPKHMFMNFGLRKK